MRRALGRLLKVSGFGVVTFGSGEEFLAQLGREPPPACVVLDIQMAGMTGFDVCAALNQRQSRIPVILITAHNDSDTWANLRAATAVAWLFKPVDEGALIDAVTRAAGLSRDA
ncbi:MAG: response regulator [Candidatus Rokubacteria bacterium]|nr:response regulator [Candidatus Rokubacteria bacterium]